MVAWVRKPWFAAVTTVCFCVVVTAVTPPSTEQPLNNSPRSATSTVVRIGDTVVKKIKDRGAFSQHAFNLVGREVCVLKQLQQFSWCPRYLGNTSDTITMSFVGEKLTTQNAPADSVVQFKKILDDMASVGVHHNDIMNPCEASRQTKHEVMVSEGGSLSLVDFGWATIGGAMPCNAFGENKLEFPPRWTPCPDNKTLALMENIVRASKHVHHEPAAAAIATLKSTGVGEPSLLESGSTTSTYKKVVPPSWVSEPPSGSEPETDPSWNTHNDHIPFGSVISFGRAGSCLPGGKQDGFGLPPESALDESLVEDLETPAPCRVSRRVLIWHGDLACCRAKNHTTRILWMYKPIMDTLTAGFLAPPPGVEVEVIVGHGGLGSTKYDPDVKRGKK